MKGSIRRPFASMLLAGVAAMVLVQPAFAQEEAGDEARDDAIIVTATRVGTDITDVPVAVNVLDSEMLENRRVQSVGDVLNYTPGAISYGNDDPSNQSVFIRGVGSDILGASADAAVVTMIDGAVISRTWMRPGALFDLNRVEVARGPQGTTFGRNATGGVVQFISNRPVMQNEGDVQFGLGNYGLFETRGAANAVLSEQVAVRLAAYYQERDGYFTNELDPKETFGDRDAIALRGQLLFEATDTFELLIRGNYSDEHIDEAVLGDLRNGVATYPFFGTYTPRDSDPRSTQTSTGQFWDRELWDIGFEATLEAGDHTVTWTGNYAEGSLSSLTHPWAVPFLAYRTIADERATVWQSELRVDNSASSSPLQYVAGLYYLNEDVFRQEEKQIQIGDAIRSTYHDFIQLNVTDSIGVFANFQYEFPTGTTVAVGGRYSYDKKDYQVPFMSCSKAPNPDGLDPVPGGRGSPICGAFLLEWATGVNYISGGNDANWDDFSYRLSVSQELGADINLYASWATAYKGGGFPNEPNSGRPEAFIPYNPETVRTVELGLKGVLLDGGLRFEFAAFDSKYDDRQQETILQPIGTNVVFNVDSATIQGVEGQVSLDVTDNFNIIGNITLLDFKDDTTGLPLPGLAKTTAFLAASYEVPLPGGSSLNFGGDLRYRSSRLNEDSVPLTIPGETLLGANVNWTSADDALSLSIWGRNLTNELDVQGLSTRTVLSANGGTLTPGAPRTYGVTAAFRF